MLQIDPGFEHVITNILLFCKVKLTTDSKIVLQMWSFCNYASVEQKLCEWGMNEGKNKSQWKLIQKWRHRGQIFWGSTRRKKSDEGDCGGQAEHMSSCWWRQWKGKSIRYGCFKMVRYAISIITRVMQVSYMLWFFILAFVKVVPTPLGSSPQAPQFLDPPLRKVSNRQKVTKTVMKSSKPVFRQFHSALQIASQESQCTRRSAFNVLKTFILWTNETNVSKCNRQRKACTASKASSLL